MYLFQKNMLGLYIKYIYIQYKLYEYKYIHVYKFKYFQKYILYVCVFIYA